MPVARLDCSSQHKVIRYRSPKNAFQYLSLALIVHINKRVSDTGPLKYILLHVTCLDCVVSLNSTYQQKGMKYRSHKIMNTSSKPHKPLSGSIAEKLFLFIHYQKFGCQAGPTDKRKKPVTPTHTGVINHCNTRRKYVYSTFFFLFSLCYTEYLRFSF